MPEPQDELTEDQRAELSKVREKEDAVTALVAELTSEETKKVADLKRISEEAAALLTDLGVSDTAVLEIAGWPQSALDEVKEIIGALSHLETQLKEAQAGVHAEGDATWQCIEVLEALMKSWNRVAELDVKAQAGGSEGGALVKASLEVKQRFATISPLCDALLDQAVELNASVCHRKDGQSDAEKGKEFREKMKSFCSEDWVKETLRTMELEAPDPDSLERPRASILPSKDVARWTRPVDTVPVNAGAVDEAKGVVGGGVGLDDLDATRAEPAAKANGSHEPTLEKIDEAQPSAKTPEELGFTIEEFWGGVCNGNIEVVKTAVEGGFCTAELRDAAQHSPLWDAVAFQQHAVATYLLAALPPGKEGGWDLTETHQRTGDSFLHLLCRCPAEKFDTPAAELFRDILLKTPEQVFHHVNGQGFSFLHNAAYQRNFWVLRAVLTNSPALALQLIAASASDPGAHPPLQCIVEASGLEIPRVLAEWHAGSFPGWFRLPAVFDENGIPAFSDVAFDIPSAEATIRMMANAVVLAAHSPVLQQLVEDTKPVEGIRILTVQQGITVEAWRCVLRFMYTSEVEFPEEQDPASLVALYQACVQYRLPQPLLQFVESKLAGIMTVELAGHVLLVSRGAVPTALSGCAAHVYLHAAHERIASDTDFVIPAALAGLEALEMQYRDAQVAAAHEAAQQPTKDPREAEAQLAAAAQRQSEEEPTSHPEASDMDQSQLAAMMMARQKAALAREQAMLDQHLRSQPDPRQRQQEAFEKAPHQGAARPGTLDEEALRQIFTQRAAQRGIELSEGQMQQLLARHFQQRPPARGEGQRGYGGSPRVGGLRAPSGFDPMSQTAPGRPGRGQDPMSQTMPARAGRSALEQSLQAAVDQEDRVQGMRRAAIGQQYQRGGSARGPQGMEAAESMGYRLSQKGRELMERDPEAFEAMYRMHIEQQRAQQGRQFEPAERPGARRQYGQEDMEGLSVEESMLPDLDPLGKSRMSEYERSEFEADQARLARIHHQQMAQQRQQMQMEQQMVMAERMREARIAENFGGQMTQEPQGYGMDPRMARGKGGMREPPPPGMGFLDHFPEDMQQGSLQHMEYDAGRRGMPQEMIRRM